MASITTKFRFLVVTATKTLWANNNLAPFVGVTHRFASISAKTLPHNLSLVTTSKEKLFDSEKRPIVLLYCWLLAKDKHIKHYTNLYDERGFDILQVKVSPQEVLWPKSVQKTVTDVGDFLTSSKSRPILVHGFSVGGFAHIEVLRHLMNSDNKSESQEVIKRMKGQIFDSVVDVIGVAEGISVALFTNQPILQKISFASINGYLKVMENYVTAIHRRASGIFHANSLGIPSLMLYSKNDPIGSSGPIESAMKSWKEKHVLVMSKCWDDSSHVGHYKAHKDEYISTLDGFLKNIGLVGQVAALSDRIHPEDPIIRDMPVTQVSEKPIYIPKTEEYPAAKRKIFASHKSGI